MDKSRQQFEEWFKREYPLIEAQPENTLLQSIRRQCLKSWQASREILEIELPDASDSDSGCPNYHDGYNTAMSRAYDAITEHGVKVHE